MCILKRKIHDESYLVLTILFRILQVIEGIDAYAISTWHIEL
jgi:hypothetical protein